MCCKNLDEATARENQIREQNLSVAVEKVLAWARPLVSSELWSIRATAMAGQTAHGNKGAT